MPNIQSLIIIITLIDFREVKTLSNLHLSQYIRQICIMIFQYYNLKNRNTPQLSLTDSNTI